ncbi:hypothetical protein, partial [Pseudomonas helleri]
MAFLQTAPLRPVPGKFQTVLNVYQKQQRALRSPLLIPPCERSWPARPNTETLFYNSIFGFSTSHTVCPEFRVSMDAQMNHES